MRLLGDSDQPTHLILRPQAHNALQKAVLGFSERILLTEFDGSPETTVMIGYSPTNVTPAEGAQKFYGNLEL